MFLFRDLGSEKFDGSKKIKVWMGLPYILILTTYHLYINIYLPICLQPTYLIAIYLRQHQKKPTYCNELFQLLVNHDEYIMT